MWATFLLVGIELLKNKKISSDTSVTATGLPPAPHPPG
jgi:hypothetical protein